MVVAEIPDIGMHLLQYLRGIGIHRMNQLLNTLLILLFLLTDQGTFHIRDNVVAAVQKCKNVIRNQFFIIPLSIHVFIESDITCKYQ